MLFVVSSLLGYLLYRRYRVDDTLEVPEDESEGGPEGSKDGHHPTPAAKGE